MKKAAALSSAVRDKTPAALSSTPAAPGATQLFSSQRHHEQSAGTNTDTYTDAAARKAVYRLKQKMPQSHKKYARLVKGLLDTAPREAKRELEDIGVTLPSKKRQHTLEMISTNAFVIQANEANREEELAASRRIAARITAACEKGFFSEA